MSGESSMFQIGGGGYDYENYVQSSFLVSMILETNIPLFPTGKIKELAFQCKNKGYITDDLFLEIQHNKVSRVLIQIKYNIAISEKNEVFFDVVKSFWQDFNNEDSFDKTNDKFFLIKSGLTNDDKNHIVTLSDWASTHSNEEDFYSEVNRIKIKKEKLEIFESLLKRANEDIEVPRKSIWEFLNCFHLLAYDFANQGSVSESHILNLIKLSKNKHEDAKAFDIWNACLVKCSEYNRNGGSVTSESISSLNLHQFFDLSLINGVQRSIKKLRGDGNLVIKPFKSTVQGHHISRGNLKMDLVQSLKHSKITFITGSPGVGKSAILKEVVLGELKNAFTLIFKADQFNKPTIAQVFNDIGITNNLQEVFQAISLHQQKYIIIDSAEKLLEGDPDNAFRQLISLTEEVSDLYLILTSRSYAVNILCQKFALIKDNVNVIKVPQFTDEELNEINEVFPVIEPLLNNREIKKVLYSPKYLELALISIKGGEVYAQRVTVSEFKDKLWNQIIENSTVVRSGIARKRRKTFMHIAVGRATEMSLFFRPIDSEIDFEALDELINDEVIINNESNSEFSPSHDILEDWALIKYIEALQRSFNNKGDFYGVLGNQPALRRAFRLWIEEILISDIDSVNNLVRETLINNQIERYWVDEILTAIFRSDKCDDFFRLFKDDLLKDKAVFLNRCILIIRTTCREYSLSSETSKDFLFPVGSGWQEVLSFISENISDLDDIRNSTIGLLLDWEYKYLFKYKECSKKEVEFSCKILLHFISQMENSDKFWSGYDIENKRNQLIDMLWGFSGIATQYIRDLLGRCNEGVNEYGRLYGFPETLIKKAIGGLRNFELVKELPDLLIKLANKHWRHTPIKESLKHKPLGFRFPSVLQKEDVWGVSRNRFDFFPSGIYKTFIYNLFRTHPGKATKFIVDFINYITLSYKGSEYSNKDELKEIEVRLNDGSVVTQYGNHLLWCSFRGTTVTHYLLESILVGFEKYLFELTRTKVEENKTLMNIVNYCFEKSNSVTITSVLVSAFMAKPKPFGDTILPVLRTKEFYQLDVSRATSEHSALEVADTKIPFAQKEKWKSNKLPHRQKYITGLRGFIFEYQFLIGELNSQIYEILDQFYKDCKEDIFWEKAILEMDRRKYKATVLDNEKGTIQLEVSYPEDVQKAVEGFTENRKDEDMALSHSAIINKVNKGEQVMTFEEWINAYDHYKSESTRDTMFDQPVSISTIGLNQFKDELTDSHKGWCLETIAETNQKISKYIFWRGWSFEKDIGFNIMEQKLATQSIHLLYEYLSDEKSLYIIDNIVSYLLISLMADHERREFFKYFRDVLSEKFPEKVKNLNLLLIKYSEFIVKNKRPHYSEIEELNNFKELEFKFIEDTIKVNSKLDVDSLNFNSYESSYLIKSLLMISPKTVDSFQKKYILKMTLLIFEDLKLEYGGSYNRGEEYRKIDYVALVDLRFYFNQVLLFSSFDFSCKIIDILFSVINGKDINKDILELINGILGTTITRFDDVIVEGDEKEVHKYGDQFWKLWKYTFDKVKQEDKFYFTKQLLMDANGDGWSIKSDNWNGFMDRKEQYESMIRYYGDRSMKHLINVFSSFGEKTFLPEGISWIFEFLEQDKFNIRHLNNVNSVKLIQLLFNNHISKIKQSQKLVSEFIYILNSMVNLGYSEAYLIRECVIIYKKSA